MRADEDKLVSDIRVARDALERALDAAEAGGLEIVAREARAYDDLGKKGMRRFVMLCAVIGSGVWAFYEVYQAGYRQGSQVVWTYETLGKCDAENGKTILP